MTGSACKLAVLMDFPWSRRFGWCDAQHACHCRWLSVCRKQVLPPPRRRPSTLVAGRGLHYHLAVKALSVTSLQAWWPCPVQAKPSHLGRLSAWTPASLPAPGALPRPCPTPHAGGWHVGARRCACRAGSHACMATSQPRPTGPCPAMRDWFLPPLDQAPGRMGALDRTILPCLTRLPTTPCHPAP